MRSIREEKIGKATVRIVVLTLGCLASIVAAEASTVVYELGDVNKHLFHITFSEVMLDTYVLKGFILVYPPSPSTRVKNVKATDTKTKERLKADVIITEEGFEAVKVHLPRPERGFSKDLFEKFFEEEHGIRLEVDCIDPVSFFPKGEDRLIFKSSIDADNIIVMLPKEYDLTYCNRPVLIYELKILRAFYTEYPWTENEEMLFERLPPWSFSS